MEEILSQIIQSGGPIGVIAAAIVYLIISIQRRNINNSRDTERDELKEEIKICKNKISDIQMEKNLLAKDVSYLLAENDGIKNDIKEMKTTLQTMALALERIAAFTNKE